MVADKGPGYYGGVLYYTYVSAARYLGMPFYVAESAIKAHAAHAGISLARYCNTLPVEVVEGIADCATCKAQAQTHAA